jgi:hypothetical protein
MPSPTTDSCFREPLTKPPHGAVLKVPSWNEFLLEGTVNIIAYAFPT